jgi:enterochelin esterase family protein
MGIGTGPERPVTGAPPAGAPGGGPGGGAAGGGLFGKDVLEDVIPFVEGKFRTLKDQPNRAIGGLSMGGGHTVQIGFPNTKIFSHIVVMSAGGGQNMEQTYADFFKSPEATNKQLKLLWVSVGKDDFALNGSKALDEVLTKNKIKHTFVVTEGRHEWVIWRHALRDVAPLMFK